MKVAVTMPFKEQTRFILPILVVSVLLLLLSSIAAWYLHHSQRKSTTLLDHNMTRLQAADELLLIGEQLQIAATQTAMENHRGAPDRIPNLKKSASRWIVRADELTSSNEDQALVDELRTGYEQFLAALDSFVSMSESNADNRASAADLNDIFDQRILQPAREYQRHSRDQLGELTIHNRSITDRMGFVLVLLGVSGALAGLLAGFSVARGIQRTLLDNHRAMHRSEQLATLGRVAAALAHELRNPLTSMRIIVQSAKSATTTEEVTLDQRDFSILKEEIERLDGSIQTFLDYARPPRPEKRSCIVQSLVQQTATLVTRRAAQIDVEIRNEMSAQPIEIIADPGQIKQVLLNLFINSLDASPKGGTITIRARTAPTMNDSKTNEKLTHSPEVVEIVIADTGEGLPEDLGTRIFDAFVSTKETGTGLGLAICKRIIDDHGGEIDARANPDGGAVFSIRLPKVPKNATKTTQPVVHATSSH